ncbi:protein of unknown function [Serratia sp. Tan611]|nr:protein of unknown function [Serratia sp. Tan611]
MLYRPIINDRNQAKNSPPAYAVVHYFVIIPRRENNNCRYRLQFINVLANQDGIIGNLIADNLY